MNNLIEGVASAAGQLMALSTVSSHHVWLGLTTVSKLDREDVPIQGLFGSISPVAQRLKKQEEESLQLSCHFAHLKGKDVAKALQQQGEECAAIRVLQSRRPWPHPK